MKKTKNNSVVTLKEKVIANKLINPNKQSSSKKPISDKKSKKQNAKKSKQPIIIQKKQEIYYIKKKFQNKSRSKSVLFQHKNMNPSLHETFRNTFLHHSKEKKDNQTTQLTQNQKSLSMIDHKVKQFQHMGSGDIQPYKWNINYQPDHLEQKILQNQSKIKHLQMTYHEIKQECEYLKTFTKDLKQENIIIKHQKDEYVRLLKIKDDQTSKIVKTYEKQKQSMIQSFQIEKKTYLSEIHYLKTDLQHVEKDNEHLKENLKDQVKKNKQLSIKNEKLYIKYNESQQNKRQLANMKENAQTKVKKLQCEVKSYDSNCQQLTQQKKKYQQRLLELQLQKKKIKRYASQLLQMLRECKKMDSQ